MLARALDVSDMDKGLLSNCAPVLEKCKYLCKIEMNINPQTPPILNTLLKVIKGR